LADRKDLPEYKSGVKRPEDEFDDLNARVVLREESVSEDDSIIKQVTTEGRGRLVDPADTVYYKHETRFDNGQLVDLSETRKV
jgi:hypothetical protein